jgi:hypothetical protein
MQLNQPADFQKCACPHCGQSIEYLAEGMGQIAPCPACEKPVTLLPDIVIPTVSVQQKPKEIKPAKTNLEKPTEAMLEWEKYVAGVRSAPATDKQKEKLRYFGYTVKPGMTKGEASDALDQCVKKFPLVERAYYGRPATEEQLAKLRAINESPDVDPEELYYDPEEPLTYQEAKDAIHCWELDQRRLEREKEQAYLESDESKIEDQEFLINGSIPAT